MTSKKQVWSFHARIVFTAWKGDGVMSGVKWFVLVIFSVFLSVACVDSVTTSPDPEPGSGDPPAGWEEPDTLPEEGEKPIAGPVRIDEHGRAVILEPDDILVLVNKERALPADYEPDDLVYPDIPFSFSEMHPKRQLRAEAAQWLERLCADAKEEGIELVGVSGYRSYQTQQSIYNYQVNRLGQEAADRISARPGHSEHQTGLAMDVSAASVGYALEERFGETPEGIWLAQHAADYGFIIRYPAEGEEITGYQYEPWHLRYVGIDHASKIAEAGLTLEEYLQPPAAR